MDPIAWELGAVAFAAGLVDAMMGGGGMLQVPALFALLPGAAPAALLGTNKFASSVGTAGAAAQYVRSLPPRWGTLVWAVAAAFSFSLLGAWALTLVPASPMRKALPFLLLGLLIYTAFSRLGLTHAPRYGARREAAVAAGGAAAVGFYDGFFGPGAGAFYKLVFVRLLGFDFLNAAAPAKLANLASNLGAIPVFVLQGVILWKWALVMAVANFAGGQVGARIALRYGNRLVRWVFLVVVAALVARTFADAYGPSAPGP
jgi:uncharacterized membrane protein YfcA